MTQKMFTLITVSAGLAFGLVVGYFLFAPVVWFIVPKGSQLFQISPGELITVKMRFMVLFGILTCLLPLLSAVVKTKYPKSIFWGAIGAAGFIAPWICAVYLKQQLLWVMNITQDMSPSFSYVPSLQALRLGWVPLSGIAAMLIMVLTLKITSRKRI